MEKKNLQSKVIDVLRFPMIVGVVLWHSFFEGIMGLDIPDSLDNSAFMASMSFNGR